MSNDRQARRSFPAVPFRMTSWNPLINSIVKEPFDGSNLNFLVHDLHLRTDTGSTALHFAALQEDPRFVTLLLRAGAQVNRTNYYRETALHWAVKEGNEDVVRLLLSAGAQFDLPDMDNATPLMWAIQEDQAHLLPLFHWRPQKSQSLPSKMSRLLSRAWRFSLPERAH